MSSEYDSSDNESSVNYQETSGAKFVNHDSLFFEVEFDKSIKQINEKIIHLIFDSNNKSLYFLGKLTFKLIEGEFIYIDIKYNSNNIKDKEITIWQSTAKSISPLVSNSDKVILEVYIDKCKVPTFKSSTSKFRNIFHYPFSESLFALENHFQILTKEDKHKFRELETTSIWKNFIDQKIQQSNKTTTICLGAKNSGKTTFNKQLLDNYRANGEDVIFIDLDPGQQVFGQPGCISICEFKSFIQSDPIILGDSLMPFDNDDDNINLVNVFIGSYDCAKYYQPYTDKVLNLLKKYNFEYENVIVNMPGWMNGLGREFISLVIRTIKTITSDVEVLFLGSDSEWQKFNIEINIDSFIFSNSLFDSSSYNQYIQQNWNSTHLREYRLLTTLHDLENDEILLRQKPCKITYGFNDYNIKLIKFIQLGDQIPAKNEELTFLKTLPGSLVGIFKSHISDKNNNTVVKPSIFNNCDLSDEDILVTQAVVHSVNTIEKYMNIIIPKRNIDKLDILNDSSFNCYKLLTTAIGLPSYDFIPNEDPIIQNFNGLPPYITDVPLKKNEHTWKVRKNIMRKSQR